MTTLELYHDTVRRFAAAGIPEADTEAALLIRHFLDCTRAGLFLHGGREVAATALAAVNQAVARRLCREPLAYILGEQEFFGRPFAVGPAVLIPRPETELLVERAIAAVRGGQGEGPPRLLDLGTGSGVIAITLALELPTARVVAVDLSLAALAVARANAIRHGVGERISWLNGDWGAALATGCRFDLVAANPPYVAANVRASLQPELAAEPALALYGGDDGRQAVNRLLVDTGRLLAPGGTLFMEIGYDQGDYVLAELATLGGYDQVAVHRDYANLPRMLQARRFCS